MQHDILKILFGLDLRSNFEVDFPRLSPASPSVRPLPCGLTLVSVSRMIHRCIRVIHSVWIAGIPISLADACRTACFFPTTIPVGIRFPGMTDGTQPAGRARDGNDAI